MSNQFKAFLVDKNNDGSVNSDFTQLTTEDLPKGEVLIKSLNLILWFLV